MLKACSLKAPVSINAYTSSISYIRFRGLTTLSSPSIFRAKHNFNSSPNSPFGKPFLSTIKLSNFFWKLYNDHTIEWTQACLKMNRVLPIFKNRISFNVKKARRISCLLDFLVAILAVNPMEELKFVLLQISLFVAILL